MLSGVKCSHQEKVRKIDVSKERITRWLTILFPVQLGFYQNEALKEFTTLPQLGKVSSLMKSKFSRLNVKNI